MREDVVLRNLGREAVSVVVTLMADADFADLFAVKERRAAVGRDVDVDVRSDGLTFTTAGYGGPRGVVIRATGRPDVAPGRLEFRAVVPGRSEWSTCVSVETSVAGRPLAPRHRCGEPLDVSLPARRMRAWRGTSPGARSPDASLIEILRRSVRDLGALQIQDPELPDRRVVAAGAPWFMALFGRDVLLTSWMALPGLPPHDRVDLSCRVRLGQVCATVQPPGPHLGADPAGAPCRSPVPRTAPRRTRRSCAGRR
jgi:glycogen debranching enzyme